MSGFSPFIREVGGKLTFMICSGLESSTEDSQTIHLSERKLIASSEPEVLAHDHFVLH